MNLNDLVYELGDEYEDFLCLSDHCFDVEGDDWKMELDLDYAQGDYQ